MQILLYTYYFLRSVVLRGPVNTVRLIRDDLFYEKKFGLQTAVIKRSRSSENFHYQGASYRVLFSVFGWLKKDHAYFAFTDIGCGKGRVLFLACRHDFSPLTGIELDRELLETARNNLGQCTAELVAANALDHVYASRNEIYFLFNPFNAEVLKGVVNRILSQNGEKLIFVYMNPLYQHVLKSAGLVLIKRFKTGLYTEAVVYARN